MKVAISVPDRLHHAADRAARRLKVPRSRLYAKAIEAYLATVSEDDITRRLDEVYTDTAGPADLFLAASARATLRRSR